MSSTPAHSIHESVLNCNFDAHSSKLNSEQNVIMSNSCSPINVLGCIPRSYFLLHAFDTDSLGCSSLNGSEISSLSELDELPYLDEIFLEDSATTYHALIKFFKLHVLFINLY